MLKLPLHLSDKHIHMPVPMKVWPVPLLHTPQLRELLHYSILYRPGVLLIFSNHNPSPGRAHVHAGFLQQLRLWHEMRYVFKPDHPGYTTVMMRQQAMRYHAGEELSSITTDLAVPSEAAAQVFPALHTKSNHRFAMVAIPAYM